MNRTARSELETLHREGDPLERRIVQDGQALEGVLLPYAAVWVDHILPRRASDNPWNVSSAWMPFAGSHYTALVRIYQAWQKYEDILRISRMASDGRRDPALFLELHDVTESFWRRIDQAIDHLGFAFQDAPFDYRGNVAERLNSRWDRSQQSDNRDVLFKFYGRMPAMARKGYYETFYPREWQAFLSDAKSTWWELYDWIHERDDVTNSLDNSPALTTESILGSA